MHANDIVLLSKSSQGLQEKLNKLKDICNDWCLYIDNELYVAPHEYDQMDDIEPTRPRKTY